MRLTNQRCAIGLAVAVLLASLAAPAQAGHTGSYFSIERSALFVDGSLNEQTLDSRPVGIRFKLGTRLTRWFDIEGQFGGASENTKNQFNEDVDARFAGLYLKGHLPLGYRTSLFALAGVGWAEISEDFRSDGPSDQLAGFSFGVGVATQITKRFDLTADYINYGREEGVFDGLSAVNFGVKLYF